MGPKNSTRKCVKPVSVPENIDFELPDWSGMEDSSSRISAEAAFRLCEELVVFAARAGAQTDDRPEKCLVEFVL